MLVLDGAGKESSRKRRLLIGGEGGRAGKSWTECPLASKLSAPLQY